MPFEPQVGASDRWCTRSRAVHPDIMMYSHHFCQYPPDLCTIPLCSTTTFLPANSPACSSVPVHRVFPICSRPVSFGLQAVPKALTARSPAVSEMRNAYVYDVYIVLVLCYSE